MTPSGLYVVEQLIILDGNTLLYRQCHLIQLMERRKATLNPREQRETVRAMLRDKKLATAYSAWAEGLRARAYVEFRDPPSKL